MQRKVYLKAISLSVELGTLRFEEKRSWVAPYMVQLDKVCILTEIKTAIHGRLDGLDK